MPHPSEFHDELWKKRALTEKDLNPANASANMLLGRVSNPHTILDVGCGIGTFLETLPNATNKSGVDFSKEAVQLSKKKGINAKQADINQSLPFSNSTFDVVTSIQVLQHVEDPIFVLREMERVSKKYVLVNVPNHLYWRFRINIVRGQLPAVMRNIPSHRQLFSMEKITHCLEQACLTIIEQSYTGSRIKSIYPPLTATGFTFLCRRKSGKP